MAPVFTWTGCYIGGNAGGLWATKNWNVDTTGVAQSTTDLTGGVAGGQIGCNYQVSTWVFGIQGDYDWANASGSSTDAVFAPAVDQSKIKALASVTGRAGYAWDRFLGYVKGGGAWVNDSYSVSSPLGEHRQRDAQRLDPRGRRRICLHRLAHRLRRVRLLQLRDQIELVHRLLSDGLDRCEGDRERREGRLELQVRRLALSAATLHLARRSRI